MMLTTGLVGKLVAAWQSTTPYELFGYGIILIVVQWLLLMTYRLTLHPLAKYPGRFIDKISGWPHIIQCHLGNRHLYLLEAHRRYGHVVRNGPNSLDFDTVLANEAIHKDRNANVLKGEAYKVEPAIAGECSVQTIIDKTEHDFRRRVLAPAFSAGALRSQEPYIDANVRLFLKKVGADAPKREDGWTETKDFSVWITYFGFDFVSDLSFGSSFRLLEEETHRYLPSMIMRLSRFLNTVGYLPCGKLVRLVLGSKIMQYFDSSEAAESYKYYEASERKLEERKSREHKAGMDENHSRKDIFHYLFHSKDPATGFGFTHQQLVADSGLFIGAGSDGVAVTLAGAMFYLLRDQKTLATLAHEIRSKFSNLDDIKGPDLHQLPYLNGVVHEGLRLAPLVLSALPRAVQGGGIDIGSMHIPSGTTVGVSAYCIHHNEDYFPDPFAFRPERWTASEKTNVSLARRALFTFSAGRYDCIGKNIAILACKLMLAKMLWAYDVRAEDDGNPTGGGAAFMETGRERDSEFQLLDYMAAYRSGPNVQFKERVAFTSC